MVTNKQSNLLYQLTRFGLGPIIGLFIGMMTVPITTRLVVPEEFGKSSLFTLIETIFTLVALAGIDQAYVRYYNVKDLSGKKTLLYNSVRIPLLISIALSILFLLFGKPISMFMFSQYEPTIIIFCLLLFPSLVLNRFSLLSIRMQLKGRLYSLLSILQQIISFVFLLLFLLFYERTFRSIILSSIIGSIISTILAMVLCGEMLPFQRIKSDKGLQKELLRFGLPLVPASILYWLMNSFDKMSIRHWSTFEELGLYAAAFKIASLLGVFQTIFTTTWVPVAYKWYEEGVSAKKFQDVSIFVSSAMFLLFSFVVFFRKIILLFLGSEYRNTDEIFIFLLFTPVLYTISETTCLGINFSKKTVYNLYISIICAVINIIGNYLLVSRYGALGAAITTCISYIVFFLLRTVISMRFWIQFNLSLYLINILLVTCLVIGVLLDSSTYICVCIFSIILIYNSILLKKVLGKRHENICHR